MALNKFIRPILASTVFILSHTIQAQIIFETDFTNDENYYVTNQGLATYTNVPEGFDGALVAGTGFIQGMAGEGVDGSVALKFFWDPTLGQPVASLFKHLTGDINTGYDEVYIRYQVRLPNDFMLGNPGQSMDSFPYWKWGRLWQNTGLFGAGWTENRIDSYYVVWNFGGSELFGANGGATYGANFGNNLHLGSAGGERYSRSYYDGQGGGFEYATEPGYFQHVGNGAWDYNSATRRLENNTNQTWHTIEWRFKLASSDTANDGISQMWFDGEEQIPIAIGAGGSAPSLPELLPTGIPTAVHGSGYNFLTMFDNMSRWNGQWDQVDVEGGIYVNDLVISNSRIGHAYIVGTSLPDVIFVDGFEN